MERFDCSTLCSSRGEWLDDRRTAYGCTRSDLPPVRWDVQAIRLRSGGWMGRRALPADTRLQGGIPVNPAEPFEDPLEGCPGGWYRSRFTDSVLAFARRRTEGGGRVSNPFFDRCEDELVLQLVLYLEHQQEAFEAWVWEQVMGDA